MASRMGFDLSTKQGWNNLWYTFKFRKSYRFPPSEIWIDTFAQFVCFFKKHDIYRTEDNSNACRRCHHYLTLPL